MPAQAVLNQSIPIPSAREVPATRVRKGTTDFPMVALFIGICIPLVFSNRYFTITVLSAGVNFRLMDVVIGTLLLTGLVQKFTRKGRRKRASLLGEQGMLLLLTVFLCYGAIETARGIPQYGSFAIGVARYTLLDLLWAPILILLIDTEERLSTLLYAVLTAVPIGWMIRLLYWNFGAYDIADNEDLNTYSRFIDSYSAMCLTSFTAVVFPFIAVKAPVRDRLCVYPVTVLAVVSLMFAGFAQSRSVWVSMVVVIFYFGGKLVVRTKGAQRKRVIRAFGFTLFGIILCLMAFTVVAPGLAERRLAFVSGLEADHTGYWRVQGWIWTMRRVMSQNPVFGLGFGDQGFPDPTIPENFLDLPDHNQFVTITRACGLLGLGMYLLLLAGILKYAKRVFRTSNNAYFRLRTLGFAGMIVMSFTYSFFYNHPPTLGMAIGLIIVSGRIASAEKLSHRSPAS